MHALVTAVEVITSATSTFAIPCADIAMLPSSSTFSPSNNMSHEDSSLYPIPLSLMSSSAGALTKMFAMTSSSRALFEHPSHVVSLTTGATLQLPEAIMRSTTTRLASPPIGRRTLTSDAEPSTFTFTLDSNDNDHGEDTPVTQSHGPDTELSMLQATHRALGLTHRDMLAQRLATTHWLVNMNRLSRLARLADVSGQEQKAWISQFEHPGLAFQRFAEWLTSSSRPVASPSPQPYITELLPQPNLSPSMNAVCDIPTLPYLPDYVPLRGSRDAPSTSTASRVLVDDSESTSPGYKYGGGNDEHPDASLDITNTATASSPLGSSSSSHHNSPLFSDIQSGERGTIQANLLSWLASGYRGAQTHTSLSSLSDSQVGALYLLATACFDSAFSSPENGPTQSTSLALQQYARRESESNSFIPPTFNSWLFNRNENTSLLRPLSLLAPILGLHASLHRGISTSSPSSASMPPLRLDENNLVTLLEIIPPLGPGPSLSSSPSYPTSRPFVASSDNSLSKRYTTIPITGVTVGVTVMQSLQALLAPQPGGRDDVCGIPVHPSVPKVSRIILKQPATLAVVRAVSTTLTDSLRRNKSHFSHDDSSQPSSSSSSGTARALSQIPPGSYKASLWDAVSQADEHEVAEIVTSYAPSTTIPSVTNVLERVEPRAHMRRTNNFTLNVVLRPAPAVLEPVDPSNPLDW